MTKWIGVLAALSLCGCISSVRPFAAPDGRQAYLVECTGVYSSMASCHGKAHDICGGAYDILNRFEERFQRKLEIACRA